MEQFIQKQNIFQTSYLKTLALNLILNHIFESK